jgi:transposase
MELLSTILSLPDHLQVREVIQGEQQLTIKVQSCTQVATCPSCGQESRRVHSHYWRSLQDLSLGQWSVQLRLQLVRFRCGNTLCQRQTFVERLEPYTRRYSRRTNQAAQLLTHLGFELGGQGGKRVASRYRLAVSRSTVLRLVRRSHLPEPERVRVLGIDDWAQCRGERYGTILVDLERQQVVDLLPDAEAATLAEWLQANPQVEVVSRDRSYTYAEGVGQGAPQALQIADRWHLFKNLGDTLVLVYTHHLSALKQLTTALPSSPTPVEDPLPVVRHPHRPPAPPSPPEQARAARRQYWETVFAQVHHLRAQGISKRAIAKQLGVSLSVVKKYCRLDQLPPKQSPKFKPRLIEPYWESLKERVLSGAASTDTLLAYLQALGFQGSRSTVYKAWVRLREELQLPSPRLRPKPASGGRVTPQQLVSWVFARDLSTSKQALLQHACDLHPAIELATGLAQDFVFLVRHHKPQHLAHWIEAVLLSDTPLLKQFAQGLLRDFDAVYAACCHPWSNGQTEGQVNRLKFIKRQMYGRANFDLLRLRLLYHGRICT